MRSACVAFGLLVLSAVGTAQEYIISTVAGGVPQPASAAVSMAVDDAGNVYFASGDRGNSVFKLEPSGALTRVAGNGRTDFSGDGGPATSAGLFSPQGLAVDRAGNLFIADKGHQRIRRVSPDGMIATVAGGGSTGLGDGGPAISAQLNYPGGVAVDDAGNLFIGELGRVRKVNPDGIITTVAGGGSTGLGDGGPATSAQLTYAAAVAVDSAGELFIQDQDRGNVRIRKVSPRGIIGTVASGGICCYGVITVDGAGNLFTADGNRVRKTLPNGSSTIVAGNGAYGFSGDGGPATQAQLARPIALAVDPAGNLFIADGGFFFNSPGQFRIRKVSPNGSITTVRGGVLGSTPPPTGDGGPATSAQLQLAVPGIGVQSGVAVDAGGNLFIAETGNHRIRKVSPDGIIITVAGVGQPRCILGPTTTCIPLGDGGPATNGALWYPTGVAVDNKGNLFIADASNHRVRKVAPDGIITTVAGNGEGGDSGNGGPAISAQLSASAIAVDGAGNLFIGYNAGVRKVAPDGIITTVANLGSRSVAALAVDSADNLFIAGFQGGDNDDDCCYPVINKLTTTGVLSMIAGAVGGSVGASGDGGPATAAHLGFTSGIAVDSAGNLFLTDILAQRIRKISPGGIITTIAGEFYAGYSGDGGLAIHATLNYPFALAADDAGDVYIADGFNQAVRVLRPASQSISAVVR